jgi:putative membrane protein
MIHDGSWMGGGMFFFWFVFIVLLVLLVRVVTGKGSVAKGQHDRSLEILKNRYARGEINEDKLEKRKYELKK